jgi:hypothetical protein
MASRADGSSSTTQDLPGLAPPVRDKQTTGQLLLMLRQESPTAAASAGGGRGGGGCEDGLQDDGLALEAPLRRRWVVQDDGAAAGRAGGVGAQPGVDARDVEPVPALRHHAHLLPLAELRQADGALRQQLLLLLALRRRRRAPGRRGRRHRVRVRQPRQRLQRLLLQPLAGGGRGRGRGRGGRARAGGLVVRVVAVPAAAVARGGSRGAVAPRARAPVAPGSGAAGDGGEPHDADQRAEQRGEDHHHIGVDGRGRVGGRDARDAFGVRVGDGAAAVAAALEEAPRVRQPEHRRRRSRAGGWWGVYVKKVERREDGKGGPGLGGWDG